MTLLMEINDEVKKLEQLKNCYLKEYGESINSHSTIEAYLRWYEESLSTFRRYFPIDDSDVKSFSEVDNSGNGYTLHNNYNDIRRYYRVLIDRLLKKDEIKANMNNDTENVFIAYGHNETMKEKVARLMSDLGYKPIILGEQPNTNNTIIEQLETDISKAKYGIVIYSADDEGKEKNEESTKSRARQNVVFEHGYLYGKLGRKRVCCLYEKGVELPSDLSGVLYIELDSGGVWKYKIADSMNGVGIKVDKNCIKA